MKDVVGMRRENRKVYDDKKRSMKGEEGERSDAAYLIGGDKIRGLLRPWKKGKGKGKIKELVHRSRNY